MNTGIFVRSGFLSESSKSPFFVTYSDCRDLSFESRESLLDCLSALEVRYATEKEECKKVHLCGDVLSDFDNLYSLLKESVETNCLIIVKLNEVSVYVESRQFCLTLPKLQFAGDRVCVESGSCMKCIPRILFHGYSESVIIYSFYHLAFILYIYPIFSRRVLEVRRIEDLKDVTPNAVYNCIRNLSKGECCRLFKWL